MAVNLLNTSSIAKEMQTKVTERMGDWFEAEFKAKANSASRRTRLIRSHGHTYTYARYQNTGQLSSNLKQVKKGDKVKVITGKDKNKEGVVLAAFPKQDKVIVEGVNVVKKHQKPNQAAPQGGILEVEAPIHVSNVMVIDPSNGEATKVAFKEVDGKKVRVSKKTGEVLDK